MVGCARTCGFAHVVDGAGAVVGGVREAVREATPEAHLGEHRVVADQNLRPHVLDCCACDGAAERGG